MTCLVGIALARSGRTVIAGHHSFLKASTGKQYAAVGLEEVLVVIEGVQMAVAVGDALLLAGLLIRGAHQVDKVVRVDVSRVSDATQTLSLAGSCCTILPGAPFCTGGEEKTSVVERKAVTVVVSKSNAGHFVVTKLKAIFNRGYSHVGVDQVFRSDCTFLVVQKAVNVWTA